MQMLSNDYIITGKHSIMFEELKKLGFFEYYWQICVTAPLVGYIYKRKCTPDRNDHIKPSTVFLAQLTPRRAIIMFIYKLLILADEVNEPSPDVRIEKAFMKIDTEEAKPDEQLFNSYLLGGVEVLYEKLIDQVDNAGKPHEQLKDASIEKIGKLIEEITISEESLTEELGIMI